MLMKDKGRVWVIIGVTLAVLILAVWYVNRFVLPVKVKGLITNFVKEKTGLNVSIGRINYLPFSRLYLNDIALFRERGAPLAEIEGLSLSLSLWPLLKDKKIIGRLGLKEFTYGTTRLNGATDLSLIWRPLPAHRPFFRNLDGAIKFINFSLETKALPSRIESINSAIDLDDNIVSLQKTFFNYGNTTYNMEGALRDLDKDEPLAHLFLNSDILTSEGRFAVKDNHIQIEKIDGKLLGSTFSIMGDIRSLSNPILNLYGEGVLDLSDLKKLLPRSKYLSDSLKSSGMCDAAAFFNGPLKDLKTSEASIKLSSNKVFLHGLALDDLYLDLRMDDGSISTPRLSIRPYLGILNGSFNLDLNKKDLPYTLTFALKDANLAKFSSDMNFGKEDFTGLISSKFFLRGNLGSTDSLRGSGWVTVRDGRLWETSLLKGVANLLTMPHLNAVVFKEAAGNFIVDQKRVSTDDLTFFSENVNISADGYLDFDGNIDFLLNMNITQDLIRPGDSSDAVQIANMLISQAGNYLGKVKVTGTWREPQYKFAVKPIQDVFKKELKGLLKDVLR